MAGDGACHCPSASKTFATWPSSSSNSTSRPSCFSALSGNRLRETALADTCKSLAPSRSSSQLFLFAASFSFPFIPLSPALVVALRLPRRFQNHQSHRDIRESAVEFAPPCQLRVLVGRVDKGHR